jgi:NAD(P)-dependent dehydrogenase (short-subunit alcohol dehydrogenase family)
MNLQLQDESKRHRRRPRHRQAITRQLAREGCDVAICTREEGPLRESAEELAGETGRKIVPILCDTMNAGSNQGIRAPRRHGLGGIHIVINSAAGQWHAETIKSTTLTCCATSRKSRRLPARAQAALPYLKQAGWGRIATSAAASGRTPGIQVSAGIRNIGTVNLTKSMATFSDHFGINVNAVYPGFTLTETRAADQERVRAQARRLKS